jgi:hypothetical protein
MTTDIPVEVSMLRFMDAFDIGIQAEKMDIFFYSGKTGGAGGGTDESHRENVKIIN